MRAPARGHTLAVSTLFGWGWPGSSVLTIGATGLAPRGDNWCGAPASPRLASLLCVARPPRLASALLLCTLAGTVDARCARFALLAGCTPGRSRARAGAPTLSCPRVGARLERPRALQARSLPLFCPPSARVPERPWARLPRGALGAPRGGRADEGNPHAAPPARGGSPPAHLVPGLHEPEAHVCSACRARQGWPGRGARPSVSAFCRAVAHTMEQLTHKTR